MKKLLSIAMLLLTVYAQAQIGIGTTTPNSMLDVRGSLSVAVTSFSTATTASASDNTFLFTGTSAATLTLPTAVGITGRVYWVKNISSNSSTLTIATTSSQTIDGLATWTLTQTNKAIRLLSNGTNWYVGAESLPGANAWILGGNSVSSIQNIGTTSNYDLPFITNNTEKMRLTASGNLGIGTSAFNATYPEKLLVDAGIKLDSTYQNVISGKGNTNSYSQLNIQNSNAGTKASTDVVATANNGDESGNFIDMGINSSTNSQNYFGGLNDAYIYAIGNGVNTGGNLYIGTATASRDIAFLTGGGTKSSGVTMNNERMRILGTGNVGIANGSPSEKLDVTGNIKFSGALMPGGSAGTAGYFLQSMGGGAAPVWFDASGFAWQLNGNSVPSIKTLGTTNAFDLPFITNSTEKMRITSAGTVGIGTSGFSVSNPEELLVDAGTRTDSIFQNVIVGKGNTNSYAQLNIQNSFAGSKASSDVVATADNGNEITNFVDMGINSSINNSGVMGSGNDAYLYNMGQNFLLGTGTAAKSLLFLTGGTDSATNERMRINGIGNVGIGTGNPSTKLHINGTNPLTLTGVQIGTATSADSLLTITSGLVKKLPVSTFASSVAGENYLSMTGGVITANPVNLSATNVTGILAAARFPALTGDVTNTSGTVATTITSGAVSNTKLATMAANTFKANNTGSVAAPIDITVTQATAMLNTFTTLKGLVPGTASSTTNFLRADGTWAAPTSAGWGLTGNTGTTSVTNFLGTTDSISFKIKTTGRQAVIVDSTGSVGIGASPVFTSGANHEEFLVDAGSTSTNPSTSINVMSGKGYINNYLQLNIQNKSNGSAASSDVVATNETGTEANGINFIDMGINSTGYSTATTSILNGVSTAYLYSTGNDLVMGNATASKNLLLFTGGLLPANERMRIDGSGNVGINETNPVSTLDVNGSVAHSITTTTGNLTLNATHYTVVVTGLTPNITLPAASGCTGRIYIIVNETGSNVNLTGSYIGFNAGASTNVPGTSAITIQSNGTSWYRIQ